MRTIKQNEVVDRVAKACVTMNCSLNSEYEMAIRSAIKRERSKNAKIMLCRILENAEIARQKKLPVCQDTGINICFAEIGDSVRIKGGLLSDAINDGIKKGYSEGYLRKSIVSDPVFDRKNTNTNAPAVIYTDIVRGDRLKIEISSKGFGSENMGRTVMLNPSDGREGIINFVVETMRIAGDKPCPPVVIGVGIGGTMDKSAVLSKKALTRGIGERNGDKRLAMLESGILEKINALNIGPLGSGGKTTALEVRIETFPTHIAGLPVAVSICCHAFRFAKIRL